MAALFSSGCFLDPGPAGASFVPVLMPITRDGHRRPPVLDGVYRVGHARPDHTAGRRVLFVACRIGDIPVGRLWRELALVLSPPRSRSVILLVYFPVLSSGLPGLVR